MAEDPPSTLTKPGNPRALQRPEPNVLADAVDRARVEAALFGDRSAPIRVGRFSLLERIGAGGMGEIYGAYDPELDRKVAIKLVKPNIRSSRAADRLYREAQTLARLSHRNVVQIYDVGRHDGRVFLAMEFIRGVTLESWLADPDWPRSWREILSLLVAAGRGLAAAHDAGLVHRDFKPANVLVGDDGVVRVIDFGLARTDELAANARDQSTATLDDAPDMSSGESSGGAGVPAGRADRAGRGDRADRAGRGDRADRGKAAAMALTSTGTVLGTPAYMSPEQMNAEATDRRSDQFSFCVVLYEALYKKRPYPGQDLAEVRASMLSGEPPSVPRQGGVPAWIGHVLMRGLAVAPEDRYPGMDALLAALDRDPARRRRRVGAAATALFGAAALGLLIAWSILPEDGAALDPCALAGQEIHEIWSPEHKERVRAAFRASRVPYAETAWAGVETRIDDYADRWRDARVAACEATHVRKVQTLELLELRALCLDRRALRVRGLLDAWQQGGTDMMEHAVQAADELPELDACADGEMLRLGMRPPEDPTVASRVDDIRAALAHGHALEYAGDYDRGIAIADQQAHASADIAYAPVRAEALYLAGRLRIMRGVDDDVERGRRLLLEAVGLAEASRHDQMTARIWNTLTGLRALENADVALRRGFSQRAAAAVERIDDRGLERAYSVRDQGLLLFLEQRYGEALPVFERALALVRGNARLSLVEAVFQQDLGNTLAALGRVEPARTAYQHAMRGLIDNLGHSHPRVAALGFNVGLFLMTTGELAASREVLRDNLESWTALQGQRGRMVGRVHQYLADVEQQAGDLDRAEMHARRALAIYEDHDDLRAERWMPVSALSVIEYRRGRFAESLALGQRTLALYRQAVGQTGAAGAAGATGATGADPNLGTLLAMVGEYLVALERLDEARALFDQAERMFEGAATEHPILLALPPKGRGLVLLGEKRYARAVVSLSSALALFREHPGYPMELADTAWALARALDGAGREPRRARALAREARGIYEQHGQAGAVASQAITTWLAERPEG